MNDDDGSELRSLPPLQKITVVDLPALIQRLDQAYQTYLQDRRLGMREMLVALRRVLELTDPRWHRGHREMLDALLTALIDLDRGQEPELLRKHPVSTRPVQSIVIWEIRAEAAFIAGLLEFTGVERRKANSMVANVLSKCEFPLETRRNSVTGPKSVANWRRALASKKAPPEGQLTYDVLADRLPGVPTTDDPIELRREILANLEKRVRRRMLVMNPSDQTE